MSRSTGYSLAAWVVPILGLVATIGLGCTLVEGGPDLGKTGEWVWNRTGVPPALERLPLPLAAAAIFLTVVWIGAGILERSSPHWAWLLLPVLFGAGMTLQVALVQWPPEPMGPERWPFAVISKASSGYFTIAREIDDPVRFIRDYPAWIRDQDNFHIGTHPPGLFLLHRAVLSWMEHRPEDGAWLRRLSLSRVREGLRAAADPEKIPDAARDAVLAWLMLSWLLTLATMLPIHALVRSLGDPVAAWFAAAAWAAVPAPLLFAPTADAFFPFLAALITLLMVEASRRDWTLLAILAGAVWLVAVNLSLAFIAVLPIALGAGGFAALVRHDPDRSVIVRLFKQAWKVAGFVAGAAIPAEILWYQLGVSLPDIWMINLGKHAGFYEKMPRDHQWWLWFDLVEFAAVTGPTLLLGTLLGLLLPWRRADDPNRRASADSQGPGETRPTWAGLVTFCFVATLIALDLSGRNRSEVARLWIFLTPFAAVGWGLFLAKTGARRWSSLLTVILQIVLAGLLLATVEPLLPTPIR